MGNKKIVRKEATYAAEEKGMFRLLRLTDRMPLRHDYSVFKWIVSFCPPLPSPRARRSSGRVTASGCVSHLPNASWTVAASSVNLASHSGGNYTFLFYEHFFPPKLILPNDWYRSWGRKCNSLLFTFASLVCLIAFIPYCFFENGMVEINELKRCKTNKTRLTVYSYASGSVRPFDTRGHSVC